MRRLAYPCVRRYALPTSGDRPHLFGRVQHATRSRGALKVESGAIMKFGIGQPVRRFEDQTLITGKGRYTDDIRFEKMAHAVVVRATAAHANIRRIDTGTARAMPGVLLVLTGKDVAADGLGDVPCVVP